MKPATSRNMTSGDLVADRRADYAVMLADSGDPAAAAELMEQAMELAPGWAAGWFRLGSYAEKAGDNQKAIAAFRQVLVLEPGDIFGARLKLAVLGDASQPDLPPSSYVEGLFDDYADRFDAALVKKLQYTVPEKLAALIAANTSSRIFRCTVDLGCGTGLFAAAFRELAGIIEGYDLSGRMLAKAAAKGLYAQLGKADLSLPPDRSGLFGAAASHRADLVAAADVMMYLGDLEAAFTNAATLLSPDGVFAFSVELSEATTGFELRPSLRYAHSAAHVERMLIKNGMASFAREETVIRWDAGAPILGLLLLAKPAS
ncbi:tetratricopeptide repeat protein [Rhizobium sp. KVB221]|uniref:Tetratricopeptide repeat protein n=1 Tax=Rhizobium setariae TaxID=2801340 RepID=A0A936YPH0_9HYPH|nr:methyltransferase domain-containing protein [Rhizobium setariae]MBL0371854.1 tetratricopeptide repeat protein [Rhizobium setariae]